MPHTIRPRGIIFDCDGTLIDSEPWYIKNRTDLFKELELNYNMQAVAERFWGLRFSQTISIISKETGFTFPDDTIERYRKMCASGPEGGMQPIEGVNEVIQTAKQHSKICVASNREQDTLSFYLDQAGLLSLFDENRLFSAALVANKKPAPDIFLYAAQTMGLSPEECLTIEDSVTGVTAAKAANTRVWGACCGHPSPDNHAQNLIKAGADKVFFTMAQMRTAIEDLYVLDPAHTYDYLG